MGDDELCGAETTSGTPCQNKASSCPWHGDDTPTTGRPSKLTHSVQEAIASDIERGRSMRSAARKQDLTPQTIMNWMQRGEADETHKTT